MKLKYLWTYCLLANLLTVAMYCQGDSSFDPVIDIHFLGTGGPEITRDRMGISTLIVVAGEYFLFDTGRGTLQRMGESRLNIPAVQRVFFTHLHSDHIEGLPSLWMTSWFITKRNEPVSFWGPPGTADMLQGLRQFMGHDLKARVNTVVRATGTEFHVQEIEPGPGGKATFYEDNGITITAIRAEHGDGNPALGYLLAYKGRSVLLTGDSTYTAEFGRHVDSVDVAISNVYAPSLELIENLDHYEEPIPTVVRAVSAKLASPEQASRIFQETGASMGVYSHTIFYDSSEEDIISRTKQAGFTGSALVAFDRMHLRIGKKIEAISPVPVPPELEINSLNYREILEQ